MHTSIDVPSLEEFNPQPAVTYWSRQCQRPFFKKEKDLLVNEDSESELEMSDISDRY